MKFLKTFYRPWKYTTFNNEYLVYVCTEDSNANPNYIVAEAKYLVEHKSVYYKSSHKHYEYFDYEKYIHNSQLLMKGKPQEAPDKIKLENKP